MTAFAFFGCAFTAYGPALSLFLFTIASDPVKIIILILSAFFWLLSLLFSSVLWLIVTQFSVSNITDYIYFRCNIKITDCFKLENKKATTI